MEEDMKKLRMNKALSFLLALVMILTSGLIAPIDNTQAVGAQVSELIVHYDRADISDWDMWLWHEGNDGQAVAFDKGEDAFGHIATYSFEGSLQDISFILRKSDWSDREASDLADGNRTVTLVDGKAEVWIKSGDTKTYTTLPSQTPTTDSPVEPVATTEVILHFDNPNKGDWAVWAWPKDGNGAETAFTGNDDFGQIANITIEGSPAEVGFLIKDANWAKLYDQDRYITITDGKAEVWVKDGDPNIYYENPNGPTVTFSDLKAKIHYNRFDDDYAGWKLLAWATGQREADAVTFDMTQDNDFGLVSDALISKDKIYEIYFKLAKFDTTGNIVEEDQIRRINTFDSNGFAEVWINEADPTVYYDRAKAELPTEIKSMTIDKMNTITVKLSRKVDLNKIIANGYLYDSAQKFDGSAIKEIVPFVDAAGSVDSFQVVFNENLELNIDHKLTFYLDKAKTKKIEGLATIGNVVSDIAFDEAFAFDGELGAIYSQYSTEFRLWAPTATKVNLLVFNGDKIVETIPMELGDKGVYSTVLEGNQLGLVYMYEVHVNGQVNKVVDPYAKSTTINGEKTVVVDPQISYVPNPVNEGITDPIIYELHVKDLSSHPESGITNVGKFLGLTETGTTTSTGFTTGLDYIRSLGVTHIQLLPIYDFSKYSTDENDPMASFNWGYDPVNYNTPEGAYSTDPSDPNARIRELQAAVDAIHNQGMGVIMDVVYNHVFALAEHSFNKIVPGYYFRFDEEGNAHNGTGVGNETASERAMMRKFIVDSTSYLARTYKFDGFRFDLMGIHDIKTMQAVHDALVEINPNIFILGEGWNMGNHPQEIRAGQINANKLPEIAMFDDDLRDATKGSVFNKTEPGFVNGAYGKEAFLMSGIRTLPDISGKSYDNPKQYIQYVEAHDNLTLWDKLAETNPDDTEETRLKRHKLATSIALLAQGVPFIHAGQEFARTKGGDENSYKSSTEVNRLDWTRAEKYKDNIEYVRQLIQIRKDEPLFRMNSFDEIDSKLSTITAADKLIAYKIEDGDNLVIVGHNASDKAQTFSVNSAMYTVYVKDQMANSQGLEEVQIVDGIVEIAPFSTLVMKRLSNLPEDVFEVKTEEVTSDIEYKTVLVNNPNLEKGEKRIKVEGQLGSKTEYFEVTYKNGIEVSRVLVKTEVTKEPVNKVVTVGTLVKDDKKKDKTKDTNVKVTEKKEKAPETGDSFNTGKYIFIICFALVGVSIVSKKKKIV